MGIETIGPLALFLIIFLAWRFFTRKSDRPDGSPTDPNAPKGPTL